MFKKLITNLPFSPGLASQVSFYAKRLRQEEFIRRLGVIFVTLTMTVQGFMVVSPPLPALAVGPNNIIYSGITSRNDLLQKYLKGNDNNGHNDIRQIFDHYKINETSIKNSKQSTLYANSHDGNLRSIGRYKQGFASETAVFIPGTSTTVFERNLSEWNGGPYKVLEGQRTDGTYFAVIMSCGNIVIDSGDKPERPPVHKFNATCDAITGKAEDPDGGVVPVRAWIRVVNEPKTTGEWIDITGRVPYSISNDLKSSENKTRVSVEVKDVDTGAWLPSITGFEFGPCLDPPPITPEPEPKPGPVASCSSLKWIDTKDDTTVIVKTTAYAKNTSVKSYSYVVTDSNDIIVFKKTVESSELTNTLEIRLETPGKYQVRASVTTKEETVTSPECLEIITIQDPVKPIFEILKRKEASNITQNIENANGTSAKPGDIIEYRLFTRNTGNTVGKVAIEENLTDVLEYSKLIESNGGKLHEGTGIISWGTVELQPNKEDIRTIRVRVNEAIAATPRSSGDLASYDLTLRNVYGDDVININLPCSTTGKCVEGVVQTLPNTGPGTTVLINTALVIISVYFYMWNRQIGRELKLVKKEYNYSV